MKAVIFDLDGTLLYTLEDLYQCTNYALRLHGLPERSIEEIKSFVGSGIPALIACAVPEGTSTNAKEIVTSTFRSYYQEHMQDTTKPYDGILSILDQLTRMDLYTIIHIGTTHV